MSQIEDTITSVEINIINAMAIQNILKQMKANAKEKLDTMLDVGQPSKENM